MTATLTSFRLALAELLADELDVEFVPGKPADDTVIEGRDLGFIWTAGKLRSDENVTEELLEAHVRVYKDYLAPEVPEVPLDPTELEELAETVQQAVLGNQATMGPWLVSWLQSEVDPETQGIEVTFVGRQQNVSLLPA